MSTQCHHVYTGNLGFRGGPQIPLGYANLTVHCNALQCTAFLQLEKCITGQSDPAAIAAGWVVLPRSRHLCPSCAEQRAKHELDFARQDLATALFYASGGPAGPTTLGYTTPSELAACEAAVAAAQAAVG